MKRILLPLSALLLAACSPMSTEDIIPFPSCEDQLAGAANECPIDFYEQDVYANGGTSGSMRLYMRYGGSFCPPTSDQYPCRLGWNGIGQNDKNEALFRRIEEDFSWFADIVQQNREMKKMLAETGSVINLAVWQKDYEGSWGLADEDGEMHYNQEYLDDCKYWEENYYTPVWKPKEGSCATGVGCPSNTCVCGFYMRKEAPDGTILDIACDYRGSAKLPSGSEDAFIPYEKEQ